MKSWFECTLKYNKVMENGINKNVSEKYVVDAVSFTEAEARIIYEMFDHSVGEFIVWDIKRTNYAKVFPSDKESADRWFKCKVGFISLDEKSGCEKMTSAYMLVQAADLRDAVKKLDEGMKCTMADYQIGSVTETAILDVFVYSDERHESKTDSAARKLVESISKGDVVTISAAGKSVTIDKTGDKTTVSSVPDYKQNIL
ncbi:MAG: DUF4494 domain-containing protein [Tannerellaceae bacterium]|jgi:preprotein translocase subunit YajC|nr:DUF4494 domain-containing protein [Tannerellaceae bacterium]